MPSLPRPAQVAFAVAATPLIFAVGWRIARSDRELGFGRLVEELRSNGRRPLPRWLTRPDWLAGTLERWIAVVPPRRFGPCLRRSLILLELWTRCGLRPTLHLGFRTGSEDRGGHAWISAVSADGRKYQASGPLDTVPLTEL